MAGKKSKKGANANSVGKESDEDFLKRILKTKDDATKKAAEEIDPYSKSKEVEELKATGKRAAKDLEEIEECEKIAEEFKANPPIVISKHINDISVEYKYEDQFKTKIELLKKHGFPFLSATKNTSIFSPTFKVIGRAYVRRSGQRMPLPESSIPPLADGLGMGARLANPKDSVFVLEDGDVLETENDSYVTVNDFISTDKYKREIFIYPNSEAKLDLRKKESHPEPTFMDPLRVPDVIKKKSSSTVIEYNFVEVSLVKGIFNVYILDENMDVNRFLKLPPECPAIEFLHASKTMESIHAKIISKMPANVLAMYTAKLSPRAQKVCDEISAFIELCKDGSIVIFGTTNSVKNKSSGKVASPNFPKIVPKDSIITSKITVITDRIYSDSSHIPDPRARAIIKNKFAVSQYTSLLTTKKEYEQKLKELKDKKSTPAARESEASTMEKEKRKTELLEKLKYYKQAGDTMMADATQMQLDELDPQKQEKIAKERIREMKKELLDTQKDAVKAGNEMRASAFQMQIDVLDNNEEGIGEYIRKMIEWCNNEIAKLKPDLSTNFPQYNSPKETGVV